MRSTRLVILNRTLAKAGALTSLLSLPPAACRNPDTERGIAVVSTSTAPPPCNDVEALDPLGSSWKVIVRSFAETQCGPRRQAFSRRDSECSRRCGWCFKQRGRIDSRSRADASCLRVEPEGGEHEGAIAQGRIGGNAQFKTRSRPPRRARKQRIASAASSIRPPRAQLTRDSAFCFPQAQCRQCGSPPYAVLRVMKYHQPAIVESSTTPPSVRGASRR